MMLMHALLIAANLKPAFDGTRETIHRVPHRKQQMAADGSTTRFAFL